MQAFVAHYYKTFDENRSGLGSLYTDSSLFSFEGQEVQVTLLLFKGRVVAFSWNAWQQSKVPKFQLNGIVGQETPAALCKQLH